ncbi:MAG TPA: sigma-70 family RNA polymerase sigma factor [Phycisphaerae bacterium]|nr:sigma-70 family RNA polymerase sigma factor [Phycisphaerae bacterium]
MKTFRHPEINQLAHELALSPARHRLRQIAGIARAIELVDPERDYPYSFICFTITGYRPRRRSEDAVLSGEPLRADLVELMSQLTAACPIPIEAADGPLYDVEALAQRFNVSTKTISRWKLRGLAGAWYASADEKPRLAFTGRMVQQFVARHLDFVRRGSAFAVMGDEERRRIIERARVLIASNRPSLHALTLHLAKETGRAAETVRLTIRRFDRDHPDQALFDCSEQPRAVDEAALVRAAFVAGASIPTLAARFAKRESEIRRLLDRARAAELAATPIAYVHNETFDARHAEKQILNGPAPLAADGRSATDAMLARTPGEMPVYLQELYRTPLLSREEEVDLFRRMNFLLHQAELLRRKIAAAPEAASATDIHAVEVKLEAANGLKGRIVQANLRLVVSIAKRHVFGHPAINLFELISDGNLSLFRAVEKFDYARGFRFSTYATWAITRGFARSVPDEISHADRFQTGCEEVLATTGECDEEAAPAVECLRLALADGFKTLEPRERVILQRHFGLEGPPDGQTLDEIGQELGLSKERVRQLEVRALAKLRGAMGPRAVELLAG